MRAPLLITKLTGLATAADKVPDSSAGVTHRRGEGRTFRRPLNLPATGSAPNVPGGWSSASYSGPRGNVGTDTVYLYTNIQAPGSKAFWKVHGEGVPGLTDAFSALAETATMGSFGTDRSLYQDAQGTPENRVNVSRSGTYDGYSGTFRCATGCNIEAAADGALTFVGNWTFAASLTARRSGSQAQQDTEFLYLGLLGIRPDGPGRHGESARFRFHLRWGCTNIANFSALTGTAEFRGGAVGRYALAKVGAGRPGSARSRQRPISAPRLVQAQRSAGGLRASETAAVIWGRTGISSWGATHRRRPPLGLGVRLALWRRTARSTATPPPAYGPRLCTAAITQT